MELHHVQLALPPDGEDACREFYVGVLGLTEVQKPPALATRGGLWVRADFPGVRRLYTEDTHGNRLSSWSRNEGGASETRPLLTGDTTTTGHYKSTCHCGRETTPSPE